MCSDAHSITLKSCTETMDKANRIVSNEVCLINARVSRQRSRAIKTDR